MAVRAEQYRKVMVQAVMLLWIPPESCIWKIRRGKQRYFPFWDLKNEASNKLDYNTSLDSLPLAEPLQGKEFSFKINGVVIDGITSSSTLGDVISKINTSEAGVKVSYSSIEDKFIMESKTTGDISNILMEQTSGESAYSHVRYKKRRYSDRKPGRSEEQ